MLTAEESGSPRVGTAVKRQLTRTLLLPVGSILKAANQICGLHTYSQSTSATLRVLGSAGSPHFDVHAEPPRLGSPKLLIFNL